MEIQAPLYVIFTASLLYTVRSFDWKYLNSINELESYLNEAYQPFFAILTLFLKKLVSHIKH